MSALLSSYLDPVLDASSHLNVMRGHKLSEVVAPTLASHVMPLDSLLRGGLRYGEVTEWGIPWGRGGRDAIVRFLAAMPPDHWGLWVNTRPDTVVNAPAFAAKGVALDRMRFCQTMNPLSDLKPAFMQRCFNLIVLDLQISLKPDECAFLAQRAKANHQIIILIRNFFLSSDRGNVWAKRRLNCWQDSKSGHYSARGIKAVEPHVITWS